MNTAKVLMIPIPGQLEAKQVHKVLKCQAKLQQHREGLSYLKTKEFKSSFRLIIRER